MARTVVEAVAALLLLFGSLLLPDTTAVFEIVEAFVPELTWITIVKVAEAAGARFATVQVMGRRHFVLS